MSLVTSIFCDECNEWIASHDYDPEPDLWSLYCLAIKAGWLLFVNDKHYCELHAAKHAGEGVPITDVLAWRIHEEGIGMNWARVSKDMRDALSGCSRFQPFYDAKQS